MSVVLIPLAQGCEELEAVTIIDLLRRAGIEVVTAGLDEQPIRASRGVRLLADVTLTEACQRDYDMIVLPGGLEGAANLAKDIRVRQLLHKASANGCYTAAICAAPQVLAQAGLLKGKTVTAYPGILEKMGATDFICSDAAVITDGKVVTSRGPGTAMDFALTLIELLTGRSQREQVEAGLMR
jgi:protein deglycase